MMKQTLRTFLPVISLLALLLSSCNAPATATPTEAVSAIYTAAAQTIVAKAAQATPTVKPTETPKATNTTAVIVATTALATSVPPTSPAKDFCDNSIYVADVTIPDGTVMTPGQVFDKTWTVKNTGTCTWTEGYTIIFTSGDLMSGTTRPVGQTVAPQKQVNVTVKLTAPTVPGAYTGVWRLANGKGKSFGEIVSVLITVGSGNATPTVTATAGTTTATSTSTSSSTSAPVITSTPSPTPVPPTPTATETPATPAT
jgi:hypothetical protein